ncbi:hypothetical protein [Nocardia sp. NBC_00511]|uniref:hypothetical protein n=1 Tax=Nocardia sp. NBC_00511 TaxID=2903591 RepID=UPI0030E3670F
MNAFTDRAHDDRSVFTLFVNFTFSHPVLTARSAALRDHSRRGNLFWPPRRPH